MPVLVVNVDHVATLRQARMGTDPEPVAAAHAAELAGAHGIIVHLREDRRHIQDRDVELIAATCTTRLHLEMAATQEMQNIAMNVAPHMVCLVPEKREELTTEGGLNIVDREQELADYLAPIRDKGTLASLFIDPDSEQIEASARTGVEYVELHTGSYADARGEAAVQQELERLLAGVEHALSLGLRVNMGHGLDYFNIHAFRNTPGISEYSIGHAIVSRAVLVGMDRAVADMAAIIASFSD